MSCEWKLGASSGFIVISIVDFHLRSGDIVTVEGPGLELGDLATSPGNKVALSGTTPVTRVISRLPMINITMTTNAFMRGTGFKMKIEAFETTPSECSGEPDFQCEGSTLCISSRTVCDGLKDCPFAFDEQHCYECDGITINLQENIPYTFTSPNYPDRYPNSLNCQWEFRASSGFIVITILDFVTERRYDFVTIEGPGLELGDLTTGSGNKLSLTGNTAVTRVSSRLPIINISMTTNEFRRTRGFRMKIEAFKTWPSKCSGVPDFQCENSTFCISSRAVCNGLKNCPYGFDEQQCYSISCPEFFQCRETRECIFWDQVCDGTKHCLIGDDETNCDLCGENEIHLEEDLPYNLTSPNYPDRYPNYLSCHWEFSASNGFIVISILDFKTVTSSDFVTFV
ncbi:low-density lipoprotein receptor-related protein 12-like [Acanthaster planci]|uniref:Low-density lipoprotein receptor-related protein 12-like n=1 Tax=Acanthaster planci TaxID=133434 RepID=A0A8B8A0V2_ACAPL|nr:low-density lipoprotein receptor-related protein 12-like [Acanthaster planci]